VVAATVATLAILVAGFFILRGRRPFVRRFRADVERLVSPGRIGETLEVLAKSPHRAGTPANAAAADEIARRLTAAGLKPWSDVHEVELWEPVALSLALTKPVAKNFDLHERALAEDPATAVAKEELPFLAYAPDADVEAPVVYGSHIDAWVYGAVDPSSGTAAVLEVATVLAALADRGWAPSRPVVFAFFDGEEFGMLGSTRFLETRLTGADLPALAFLDVDSAVRANDLYASTTPGLRGPLAEVLALVNDPDSGKSLRESSGEPALPGFSSDAAPFLGFSATPVAALGFGRWYGSTHTLYDTATWLKRFGDPGFLRTATLARVVALYVGVLATPRFFPLRFAELSDFTNREIREIQGRHPASISWVPQAARSLTSQIEGFEAGARAWDGRTRASRGPGKDAGRFDRNVSLALGAFGAPGESFGRGCRLWGLSPETGCGAVGLPALEEAVSRSDRAAAAREIDHLAVAFSRAREQLVIANLLADGGRPTRRVSAGARRP